MDINITFGGYEFARGYETVLIAFIIICGLSIWVGKKFKRKEDVYIDTFGEAFLDYVLSAFEDFIGGFLSEKYVKVFFPLSVFTFMTIFLANSMSLFGLQEGVTYPVFPFMMSVFNSFIWIGYAWYKSGFFSWFKGFFQPLAFMGPINLLSLFTVPLSMGARLFGNVLSGFVVMTLIWTGVDSLANLSAFGIPYFGAPFALVITGVGSVISGYFSLFSPFIQALVFTALTLVHVSGILPDDNKNNLEETWT